MLGDCNINVLITFARIAIVVVVIFLIIVWRYIDV